MSKKQIKMEIRKAMPDTMMLAEKAQFLEDMADEYRKKSRDDVHSDAAKFRAKTGRVSAEDYSPIIDKADGDEKSKS